MTDEPTRTDLAALSKYARAKGTSHPARDLILGAVEEIATLRLRLDQATTAAAELRALPEVRTAEQHKGEAERLLDLAQRMYRVFVGDEHDPDEPLIGGHPALAGLAPAQLIATLAQGHATLAAIPEPVELLAQFEPRGGYRLGPMLPPGERPWPGGWEQDPTIDDGHAHEWERITLQRPAGTTEDVVRCAICQAPRCGHSDDADPCMDRRHHRACHRYLSGRTEHVGGSAGSCGCAAT